MRYVLPSSLTWWAGLAAILIGLAGLALPQHGPLAELAAVVAELTGAEDAAPATLITLGFGLIGLRDRLERGLRSESERRCRRCRRTCRRISTAARPRSPGAGASRGATGWAARRVRQHRPGPRSDARFAIRTARKTVRNADGQLLDGPFRFALERLARWWTSATQEERFALLRATLAGEKEAPRLGTLKLAIYLAEVEAGEVSEG
jgi:hypothetical protein